MTGADDVDYAWYINGVFYADSESITVPASVAYGDRIRVIVTDEDGNEAEDTVYVGGFTIVEVEATTESNTTYKYIRATFSEALDSLDPSEIEIRRKSDKQLFSVEEVRLSADGYTADITLFGDKDKADTKFLEPATIYVMTVTHDGFSDDLEFQLPDNRRNVIVRKVDVDAGTITIAWDGRNDNDPPAVGTLKVGDAYLGNLGSLVGRNVVVGVNADNELMYLEVEDQNVVVAKVKYMANQDEPLNYDKNYFETPDGTKYYLVDVDSWTTSISATVMVDAADGDIDYQTENPNPRLALGHKDEYQYAKLVLNRNGTVATAVLQGTPDWTGHIIVTETDGTQVIESADFALDFDGYTIVKDDEYVEVEDLEEGDICYYNSNDKFVDVYSESVTGNIEKITSEKITIDGTAYKWAGAQYLKSNKYVTLDQTDIESDLVYLYSLDEDEDTTIVLNRKGDIQVIDGTVKDESKTTSSVYVLTEKGDAYTIGKQGYLDLEGSNGTQEHLVIDLSKVKKYENKDATLTASATAHNFQVDGSDVNANTTFLAKNPVKITKDEDGNVVEIRTNETSPKVGSAKLSDGTTDQTIKSDSTSLYAGANSKITLKSSTPVYIVNDKADDDGVEPFKVEKTTLGELTKTAKGQRVTAYAKSSSTAAEFIVVDNTLGDAWTTSDTETIGGVVTAVTKGLNTTSGKEEVEAITLLTASGEVELDADELGYTTDYTPGKYITFTVKKDTYTLAAEAADTTEFRTTTLDGLRAYSDSKFTSQDGLTTISKAATAGVYVYDADAKTYTATTIGAVNTKKEQASLKYHVVDENTPNVVTADMMVVTYSGLANPATVTLDASALTGVLTPNTSVLGTTVESSDSALTSVTYTLQYLNGTTWTDVTNGTLTDANSDGNLVVGSPAPVLSASTSYRIKAAGAPTSDFATVYSNTVKTAAPAFTALTITQGTYEIANAGAETVASAAAAGTSLAAVDQYGNAYRPSATETVAVSWAKVAPTAGPTGNTADLTGNLSIDTAGVVTFAPALSATTLVNSAWSAEIEGTTYYVEYTTKWVSTNTDGVLTLSTTAPANPV